jgi:hypothetical protein
MLRSFYFIQWSFIYLFYRLDPELMRISAWSINLSDYQWILIMIEKQGSCLFNWEEINIWKRKERKKTQYRQNEYVLMYMTKSNVIHYSKRIIMDCLFRVVQKIIMNLCLFELWHLTNWKKMTLFFLLNIMFVSFVFSE